MINNPYNKEQFTWCYINYSPNEKKYTICFQWLRFQGSEFHVAFDDHLDAVAAIRKLKEFFAPNYLHSSVYTNRPVWPYYNTHKEICYDFDVNDKTLDPDDARFVLGKNISIVLTPKGLTSNKILLDFAG